MPETISPGLSDAEALERLRIFGPNRLASESPASRIKEILLTFADPMALMLAASSAAYFALGEKTEAAILLCTLVPIFAVDVALEARARGALRKLAQAVAPCSVVIRNGVEGEIETERLVPGDIMLVSEGGVVRADGALRLAANLTLDESQLTGEAEPQAKQAIAGALGNPDGSTTVYAGSRVLSGHGWAEVVATGAHTSYGNLAALVAESKVRATPLQRSTARLVRTLVAVAIVAAAGLFLLSIARGVRPARAFLFAISLAMSAVGEEFLIVLATFLSLGAWRLSRFGVLVKRLASVETLGATTVICVDKTGTLTAGDFTLTEIVTFDPVMSESELLQNAVLACERAPADSIDRSIIAYCHAHRVDIDAIHRRWELVRDYPFDVTGKHMSHVWCESAKQSGRIQIVAKGALEGVLQHCDITAQERARAQDLHAALASRGIRVLALAARKWDGARLSIGDRSRDERGLRLCGLMGFSDPLRPDVPAAIADCQRLGVQLKLATGDDALTAHAVAEASGLAHRDDGIITGAEIDALSREQLDEAVRRCSIFARVRPEHKHAIVDSLERSGEVVAMTGDGINDTPAMRRADIAISMGRRATEVTRSVADLVLVEDNFAAIVTTIREGRQIFANLQRAFRYLIGFKLMLVLSALIVPLVDLPILLLPVDLVWLELIVHPVSALAFEGGEASAGGIPAAPRNTKTALIDLGSVIRSVITGSLVASVAILMYWHRLPAGENYARTVAMSAIVFGSLMMVWAEYAESSSWSRVRLPRQRRFWMVIVFVAFSLPAFVLVRPVAAVLMLTAISARDWAASFAVAGAAVGWRAIRRSRREPETNS